VRPGLVSAPTGRRRRRVLQTHRHRIAYPRNAQQPSSSRNGNPTSGNFATRYHDTASVSESLWTKLSGHWDSAQLIEPVATAGFYHLVSFTANAAGVQPEAYAERLPTPTAVR
jgi:hypothetical protein